MKKTPPFLLFLLLHLLCYCTQAQSYNIIKSQAFFRTSTAGNIQVDENGVPVEKGVTKNFLIYIETNGTVLPQWEIAYIDGLPYSIRTVEVTHTPIKLGTLKGQEKPIIVNKRPSNQLWQLALTAQQSKSSQTAHTSAIILSGTFRSKSFTYRISKVQELAKRFNP